MSVIAIHEILDRSGSADYLKNVVRKYTRTWRMQVSSPYDGGNTVMSALPVRVGDPYPDDPTAIAVTAKCDADKKSKFFWVVSVDYTTLFSQPTKTRQANPCLDPAIIEWNTDTSQSPFYKDKNGNAYLNSAGDYYGTAIKDDLSYWDISITKNLAYVPQWIDSYRDAVNSDSVSIDGVAFQIGQLKIKGIKIGKWDQRNQYWFRTVSIHIKVRDNPPTGTRVGGSVETCIGGYFYTGLTGGQDWKHYIPDQGIRVVDSNNSSKRIAATDSSGRSHGGKPFNLDGNGKVITNPTPTNAVFLCVDLRTSQPFNFLPLT